MVSEETCIVDTDSRYFWLTALIGAYMKILAHIHTFNDEQVIDLSLRSVLAQTYPVDKIILVDNASTDHTLDRLFPEIVSILRHTHNLGTSGAVVAGMKYALEHQFDWIWIFDADSAPRPDALAKLVAFYRSLSSQQQARVQRLTSLAIDPSPHSPYHGIVYTPGGYQYVKPHSADDVYECDGTIWSGSLFKVESIRGIGLPDADYVLDWGEFAYGYHGLKNGLKTYVVQSSIMDHNIDGVSTSWIHHTVHWGPLHFNVMEFPLFRLYYIIRNSLYFWLYEYQERTPRLYVHLLKEWVWIPKHIIKLILVRRGAELWACLRSIWDGVSKNMQRRY